ncbi:hypothetical protein M2232_002311 [Bradyrhizobium japonicum]|uniref:AlbA family DNA-binding domain-containing protein n=1 Tax=Bradyrhizobium japonicum TaxID=375 RepID=UPI002225DCC7|nr:ATP-binding protein [Bradyrhizobium japonicum]MCW2218779.1 hypothetical protein [Bradyrhizobium japonicum]MCW2343393.1 hypothetical protein [Bradyrhizobium japonicum]
MLVLKTRADLQRLVDEGLEESLTLDYKASPALTRDGKGPDELCKDVSALANSAGGQIIYGIEEDKATAKPARVDDGVADAKITREWIEQVLNSKVQPRMDGVRIERVDMGTGKYGYVINVEQSQNGPHQSPDGKYYKRFNLQSVPMHDYEIRDILRRSTTPDLEAMLWFPQLGDTMTVSFAQARELSQTFFLNCTVMNKSPTPAHYAIVEVWVDQDLTVPFAVDPFVQVNAIEHSPTERLLVYRRTISAPPGVPVFKEASHESHTAQIALQLPARLRESSVIYLESHVSAPGVSKHEKYQIIVKDDLLRLVKPGQPRSTISTFDR